MRYLEELLRSGHLGVKGIRFGDRTTGEERSYLLLYTRNSTAGTGQSKTVIMFQRCEDTIGRAKQCERKKSKRCLCMPIAYMHECDDCNFCRTKMKRMVKKCAYVEESLINHNNT